MTLVSWDCFKYGVCCDNMDVASISPVSYCTSTVLVLLHHFHNSFIEFSHDDRRQLLDFLEEHMCLIC